MAMDFPNSPVLDEEFVPLDVGKVYVFNGEVWKAKPLPPATPAGVYVFNTGLTLLADGVTVNLDAATDLAIGGLMEPPPDGVAYARKNDAGVLTWVPTTAIITPTVTSLDPTAIARDAAPTTLHVYGTNFTATAEIIVNLTPVATTFVSDTELTTLVDYTDTVASFSITVRDGGVNAPLPLLELWVVYPPTITSMTPTTVAAGSADFVLSVSGGNFYSVEGAATVITFDGVPIPTDFVTAGNLVTATVTPDAAAGTHAVSVNSGPIVSLSAPLTLTYT